MAFEVFLVMAAASLTAARARLPELYKNHNHH